MVLFILAAACVALISGNQQDTGPKVPPEEKAEEKPTPEEKPSPAPEKKEEKKKQDTETITVRVTGTPGVPFSGNYGKLDSSR
ncbi:MAG: hypothetical protein M3254_07855, partial [Actinomycetota bacterium]|nr:hypothetical protein [Actinomycetota bacterium]